MKALRALWAVLVIALACFTPVSAFAAQVPKSVMANTMKLYEYWVDEIQVPDQVLPGVFHTGYNHYIEVDELKLLPAKYGGGVGQGLCLDERFRYHAEWTVNLCAPDSVDYLGTELRWMDFLASRPGHQWKRTGVEWVVWKLGTPGTVPVHRIYMPTLNSHVVVSETETYGDPANTNILQDLLKHDNIYKDDGETFAVKMPVNGACETGTIDFLRLYNQGVIKDMPEGAAASYHYNDGNHRFMTSWKKYEETVGVAGISLPQKGWEIAKLDADVEQYHKKTGLTCLPAQATGLWIGSSTPDQNAQGQFRALTRWNASTDTLDEVTSTGGVQRIDLDQSRDTLFANQQINRLNKVTNSNLAVTPVMLGADVVMSANPTDPRTGYVYIVENSQFTNGVWVFDPRNPNAPRQYVLQTKPGSSNWERYNDNAFIVGDILFVFQAHDRDLRFPNNFYYNGTTVIRYDLRKKVELESIELPKRAQYATFDPISNLLWVTYEGDPVVLGSTTFAKVDVGSHVVTNLEVPNDPGVPNSERFIKGITVDTSTSYLYMVVWSYDRPGRLYRFEPRTNVWTVGETPSFPRDIALMPMNGVNQLVVFDNANNQYSFSIIDTINMVNIKNVATQARPDSMVVVIPH